MTAQQRQHPVAADEYAWRAPATAAVPRTAGRAVATTAAAAQTTVAPPRPFARPAAATTAALAQARQVTAAPPAPIPIGQSAEPPGRQPENQSSPQLPVLRIVCWQLALVLALAGIGRPWPVVAGLLTGAAALLAWTAVRVRGRWLSDEVTLRARLLLRRRGHDLPGAEAGRVLLETLAPGARVHTVELAGAPAGVISRSEELLAVLRAADADPAALARLALSGSLLADTGEPGAALPAIRWQLVLHRGPRQADQTRAWLAVRALRDPGFAADPELLVVLNNVVRKVRRTLRRAGLDATTLTEQEVAATLVALTHTGSGRGAIREERRYWRAGPIAQVGIRVSGLSARPARSATHALHALLAAVPGTACTIAITEHDAVLRVAAATDPAADSAVERLLWMPPQGLRLDRMDNQHGPAVAASLPIGGNR